MSQTPDIPDWQTRAVTSYIQSTRGAAGDFLSRAAEPEQIGAWLMRQTKTDPFLAAALLQSIQFEKGVIPPEHQEEELNFLLMTVDWQVVANFAASSAAWPDRKPDLPPDGTYLEEQFIFDLDSPWIETEAFSSYEEYGRKLLADMRNDFISLLPQMGTPTWITFHLKADLSPEPWPVSEAPIAASLSFHELVENLFHTIEHQCQVKGCTGHLIVERLTVDSTPWP